MARGSCQQTKRSAVSMVEHRFTLDDLTTAMGDVLAAMEVEGRAPDPRALREFVDRVSERLRSVELAPVLDSDLPRQ